MRKVHTLLLAVTLILSGLSPLHTSAADASAQLTPAYQSIDVGELTTVVLRVSNVENLYGYQAAVVFDPAVLEVVDSDPTEPGVQVELGSFLHPDFVRQNSADNGAGAIICVVSQLAPAAPVSGSGVLFTIHFRGKATGLSDVRFTDLRLARSDGIEISVVRQNAQVSVGGAATPTPTSVAPTPTPTPTSPAPTQTPTPVAPTRTPIPTPTYAPTPGQTIIYVVRTGDTLYSIARRFGVSVQLLAQVNGIANPRYIRVGQRLIIPRDGTTVPTPTPVPSGPNPTVYIVKRGDTMYSIARRFHTTVQALALANKIVNPSRIYVGQRLVIPGGAVPSTRIHIVQRGETLYSIARRYGTSVWAIAMANNLYNLNVIYAGQRLVIP